MNWNRFRAWIRWIPDLWHRWCSARGREILRRQGYWPTVSCAELPEELEAQTLYLWGEDGQIWQAVMACPCCCGATLHMSTLTDDWPHWKIDQHDDGTTTLSPSIWRKIGCRSHFWLRHGCIHWC